MTNRAVYASLIDGIFGSGSATFDITSTQSNRVIGALARPKHFDTFKANFSSRLRRLSSATKNDGKLEPEIVAAVNRIADSGWDGAYAELCALDYFLISQQTGPGNIILDRTVPAITTLASEMGMQNANHDLFFPGLGISMDTKLLSDKTGEILESVFNDYRSAKSIERLLIIPSYDQSDDFTRYSTNRKALVNELINSVDVIEQPRSFDSKVIPGLSYTFAWEAGAHFAVSTYDTEEHALRHHPMLFGHAKKFSRQEPTVITYVAFPWSGEKMVSMGLRKHVFFKKLGEHFFNDYVKSGDLAKKYNKKFVSGMSAGDATKHLSGLIYLDDNCILGQNPNDLNVDASFLWNAHALHPLPKHPLDRLLRERGARDLSSIQ